jgi:glutaconyl-CoA decarboxylase
MKRYRITVNGQSYDVQVEEVGGAASPAPASVAAPRSAAAPAAPTASATAAASGGAASIKAPMPGTLMAYKVAVGQAVR